MAGGVIGKKRVLKDLLMAKFISEKSPGKLECWRKVTT
jgi:hypothetical protein